MIAIVGATASGKTAVGEILAARIGGEVVCADSRQVYRELEIGTGKPSPAERGAAPHHLFEERSVGEAASAGWYARAAAGAVAVIRARGRIPILVGGSGLYVQAVHRGMAAVPEVDPAIRARLTEERRSLGPEELHRRLARGDAETAARLGERDGQRIVRALAVLESTGRPLSAWLRAGNPPPFTAKWRIVELTFPPRRLEERIRWRTGTLFASGLVEETAALVRSGNESALKALRAIGYDEALDLIHGTLDRAAAEERTTRRTLQLAKRQRTWFRHQVDAARHPGEGDSAAIAAGILDGLADG